ncbi:hypothetical protein AX16_009246 [Volvariella volvacea WC 439]|nr:hypothetical protein AX16_009246 [Volvariella volvacea WC 439]
MARRPKTVLIPALDRRIQVIDSERLALRRQRNSLVPIFRIPPEVMYRINTFIIDDPDSEDRERILTLRRSYAQRARITSICQYWRQCAINDAWLWTFLDFGYPEFVPLILQRSKHVPLFIRFVTEGDSMSTPELRSAMNAAQGHIHRVRHLFLFTQYEYSDLLRELFVDSQTHPPPLQTLTMDYRLFPQSQTFNLLSSSTLTCLSLNEHLHLSLNKLAAILRSSPRLRFLKLVDSLPEWNRSLPPTQNLIPLCVPPILEIEDSVTASQNLLSRVIFAEHPSRFRLTCRPRASRWFDDHLSSSLVAAGHLMVAFASRWTASSEHVKPIRTLHIDASLDQDLRRFRGLAASFSCPEPTNREDGSVHHSSSQFTVRLHRYTWRTEDLSSEYQDCFTQMIDVLPTQEVVTCSLRVLSSFDQLLSAIRERMPQLKRCHESHRHGGVNIELGTEF